mgnify:CR=1 FL=1
MNELVLNPANRENTGDKPEIPRNPDGTFPAGVSGNPSGRPKGTLKDYLRRKFTSMSDEEKEAFLKYVPAAEQFRMAEGNPHQSTDGQVDVTIARPLLEVIKPVVDQEIEQRGESS